MLHLLPYLEMISTTKMTMPQHKREKCFRSSSYMALFNSYFLWLPLPYNVCGYFLHLLPYWCMVQFIVYNANEREEILLKPETIWIKDFLVIVFVDTIRPDNISIQASRKPSLSFLLSITLLQNIFSNLMPFQA